MRFGAIVPNKELQLVKNRKYHLALAGEIIHDPEARRFFREESLSGSFVTLDNGAYEGDSLGINELYTLAEDIWASELCLPDKLYDMRSTIEMTRNALKLLSGTNPYRPDFRFAIIPQADTVYWWGACLDELVELVFKYLSWKINLTIAIPKHTGSWEGGRANLYDRFIKTYVLQNQCHVNLLGVSEDIETLTSLALRYPFRSVDSAKPAIYALCDTRLSHGYIPHPKCPHRPGEFFQMVFSDTVRSDTLQNIEVYDRRLSPMPLTQEIIL